MFYENGGLHRGEDTGRHISGRKLLTHYTHLENAQKHQAGCAVCSKKVESFTVSTETEKPVESKLEVVSSDRTDEKGSAAPPPSLDVTAEEVEVLRRRRLRRSRL